MAHLDHIERALRLLVDNWDVLIADRTRYWHWGRPSVDELRRDLREVVRAIHPDWDLAAPGLRERWEAGDNSVFCPYGR